jgi:hypothetical protein
MTCAGPPWAWPGSWFRRLASTPSRQKSSPPSARRWNASAISTKNNDPHGEHDFGAFYINGVGKISWKIDYYADASCAWGSEDPSDAARCYRVLTIMRAEEY